MNEERAFLTEFEVRGVPGDGAILQGYASMFNQPTVISDFREQVHAGAFKKSIRENDVRALKNHDSNYILGRSKVGPKNLKLYEDNEGLYHELRLPDTTTAREVYREVELGLIDAMSFAFSTVKNDWDYKGEDLPLRTLREVKLYDVSYVVYPAYEGTSAEARGLDLALESLAEETDRPIDELIAAAKEGRLRSVLTLDDHSEEPEPEQVATTLLSRERAVAKLELALLRWGA